MNFKKVPTFSDYPYFWNASIRKLFKHACLGAFWSKLSTCSNYYVSLSHLCTLIILIMLTLFSCVVFYCLLLKSDCDTFLYLYTGFL